MTFMLRIWSLAVFNIFVQKKLVLSECVHLLFFIQIFFVRFAITESTLLEVSLYNVYTLVEVKRELQSAGLSVAIHRF